MNHSFDVEEATKYGVNAAIILQHLKFWIQKNIANNKHHYDGEYWTYNSVPAFHEIIPYLSEKQIRSALLKLESAGIIGFGEYNKASYDRTRWYAIRETSILQKVNVNLTKSVDQSAKRDRPIPDNNPVIETDNTSTGIPFDVFWDIAPKKTDKKKAEISWNRLSRKKQKLAIADISIRYQDTEIRFIPNPTTYIHGERWEDEIPENKTMAQITDEQLFGKGAI